MGSGERHTDSGYNPATSFASDCPYCNKPSHLKVIMPDGTEAIDVTDQYTFGPPPLYCRCGVLLAPHEVRLDLGDGDELLCDHCLGLSN